MNTTTTSETRTLYTFVEYAKLKPHSIIVHKRFINQEKSTQDNYKSLANLEKGAEGLYNGYMSDATRRRVKGLVENYLTAVQLTTTLDFPTSFPSEEIYPTFVTLTLPSTQIHCDNTIKKDVFFRFMEYLQGDKEKGYSGWNVKNYLWVAETQKNGNIHFHLILDRGIPADRLNSVWNRFCERLGYVSMFRNRMKYVFQDGFYVRKDMLENALINAKKHCKATQKKFVKAEWVKKERKRQEEAYNRSIACNWNNPPTTKIHAIRDIKKLTAYVSKYMTKEAVAVCKELRAGETLAKRSDGKYIAKGTETRTREVFVVVNGIYKKTGEENETYETEREVKVTFTNRRLRGRIWGCSKALHVEDLSPLQLALEVNEKQEVTTYKNIERKREVWRERLDLFGNKHYDKEIETFMYSTSSTEEMWINPVRDDDARNYVNDIRNAIPAADRKFATDKAGPMFSQYGEIIPISTPQKDMLQSISPILWKRYRAYYQHMFYVLYPENLPNTHAA